MTQLLCVTDQTIPPLFSQDEMKVKVYMPGGFNQKCMNNKFDTGVQHHVHYSAANKLKILAAVDCMMAEENLRQNQACAILQACDSQVLRWQASRALLEEAANPSYRYCIQVQRFAWMPSSSSWSLLWTSGMGKGFWSLVSASSERPAS
jgi:hypothetical protein